VIRREADVVEQLGAAGILRAVAKVRRDTRRPNITAAVATLRRNLETLPSELQFDRAHHPAASRIQILKTFLDAIGTANSPWADASTTTVCAVTRSNLSHWTV
jgi:uncharacterized protein